MGSFLIREIAAMLCLLSIKPMGRFLSLDFCNGSSRELGLITRFPLYGKSLKIRYSFLGVLN